MKNLLTIFLIGCGVGVAITFLAKPGEPKADLTKILVYMKALEGKEQLILARSQNQETFNYTLTDNSALARILRALFGPYIGKAQIELQCVVDYNYYVDLDDPRWKFDIVGDTLLGVTAPPPRLLKPPGLHSGSLHLNIAQKSLFINERDKYDDLVRSLSDTLSSLGEMPLRQNSAVQDTCRARLENVLSTFSRILRAEIRSARVTFVQ